MNDKLSYLSIPCSLVFIAIGMYIRIDCISFEGLDFTQFLYNWYNNIDANGFSAFKTQFTNYNYIYLYLLFFITKLHIPAIYGVKLASILFDLLLIPLTYCLLKSKLKKTSALSISCATFIIPTVFINSSAWAQCDIIYSFFLLLSVYFLLNKSGLASTLAFSIAFCFKLQSIFILPAYAIIFFSKDLRQLYGIRLWYIVIPYLTHIIIAIPAMLIGADIWHILFLKTYLLDQAASSSSMITYNAATIWAIFPRILTIKAALIISILLICLIIYIFIKKVPHNYIQNNLALLILFITNISIYLLPCMHERYFFFCDIFSFIIAFYYKNKIIMLSSLFINTASLYTYFKFLGTQHYSFITFPFSLSIRQASLFFMLTGILLSFIALWRNRPLSSAS